MERDEDVARARDALRIGTANPDAFFEERGFTITCEQIDGAWSAHLGQRVPRYGRGSTARDAKVAAVRRWMTEQEPPDLRRRPGEPLP